MNLTSGDKRHIDSTMSLFIQQVIYRVSGLYILGSNMLDAGTVL